METAIGIFLLFNILFTAAAVRVQETHLFEANSEVSIEESCVLPSERKLDYIQCMRFCLRSGEDCEAIYADGQSCFTTKCKTGMGAATPRGENLFLKKIVPNCATLSVPGKNYKLTEVKAQTFEEAKQHCQAFQTGYKPAEPLSVEENEKIKEIVTSSTFCLPILNSGRKSGFFLGLKNPRAYDITTSAGEPVCYDTSRNSSGIWPTTYVQPDLEDQMLISIMCDGTWGDRRDTVVSYELRTVCEI